MLRYLGKGQKFPKEGPLVQVCDEMPKQRNGFDCGVFVLPIEMEYKNNIFKAFKMKLRYLLDFTMVQHVISSPSTLFTKLLNRHEKLHVKKGIVNLP